MATVSVTETLPEGEEESMIGKHAPAAFVVLSLLDLVWQLAVPELLPAARYPHLAITAPPIVVYASFLVLLWSFYRITRSWWFLLALVFGVGFISGLIAQLFPGTPPQGAGGAFVVVAWIAGLWRCSHTEDNSARRLRLLAVVLLATTLATLPLVTLRHWEFGRTLMLLKEMIVLGAYGFTFLGFDMDGLVYRVRTARNKAESADLG